LFHPSKARFGGLFFAILAARPLRYHVPMKILAIDDHELVREGLLQVLQTLGDGVDIIQSDNAQQAFMRLIAHRDLDLILLDYHLPDMTGLEMLQELGRRAPTVPVLMISGMANAQLMRQVLTAGAAGFISKSSSSKELLRAIKVVLDGGIYTPEDLRDLEGLIVDGTMPKRASLSRTQERVFRCMIDGMSNRDIAHKLDIGEETVKSHVSSILRYFDVQNRTQAVLAGVNYGFRPGI
jgi:DNA-binding NarL/FixJ family response regulator